MVAASASEPALPGGVGISHVRVYDTVAPDGLAGGTPHLHTVCTEAYLVIAGSGEVQSLSSAGFERTALSPGTVAWFSPGTVHRLVNHGGLELFVVMSNAGLPEAGDLVVAFNQATLSDSDQYDAAWRLDPPTARRDMAVEAFAGWRDAVEADRAGALRQLHRLATNVVAPRAESWPAVIEASVAAAAATAADWIAAVAAGQPGHLADARLLSQPPIERDRGLGCCGTLGVVRHPTVGHEVRHH